MSKLLYSHEKDDLIKAVRIIVTEVVDQINHSDSTNSLHSNEELMTQRECANFLGVSVGTLIIWRKDGRVPFLKLGRTILYSKKQILKHFNK